MEEGEEEGEGEGEGEREIFLLPSLFLPPSPPPSLFLPLSFSFEGGGASQERGEEGREETGERRDGEGETQKEKGRPFSFHL